jgi:hypothetical protein
LRCERSERVYQAFVVRWWMAPCPSPYRAFSTRSLEIRGTVSDMATTLVTWNLHTDTGIPKDDVTQSIVVSTAGAFTSADLADLTLGVGQFYNNIPTGGLVALRDVLSPSMDTVNGSLTHSYDISGHLDGSPHGSPTFENGFVLGVNRTGGVVGLPGEVAVVLSLHGSGASTAPVEAPDGSDAGSEIDRPRSRHMGRMFLGHLASNALDASSGAVRPSSVIRDTARLAAKDLAAYLVTHGMGWCVWSRKNAAVYGIVAVSTDNAFDTQRRRGTAATSRTTLAV